MTPTSNPAPKGAPPEPYAYHARVTRWLDGDTCAIELDLGFSLTLALTVRAAGYDAYELHSKDPAVRQKGELALAVASEFAPPGQSVLVRTHRGRDKYGRYLADVYSPTGAPLAELLISKQLAVPYAGGRKTLPH